MMVIYSSMMVISVSLSVVFMWKIVVFMILCYENVVIMIRFEFGRWLLMMNCMLIWFMIICLLNGECMLFNCCLIMVGLCSVLIVILLCLLMIVVFLLFDCGVRILVSLNGLFMISYVNGWLF